MAILAQKPMLASSFEYFTIEAPSYLDNGSAVLELAADKEKCLTSWAVIQVEYDSGVDIRLQGAFDHACRIWEHVMPMMPPIKVKVRCEPMGKGNQYARVIMNCVKSYLNFMPEGSSPFAQVKGVVGAETVHLASDNSFGNLPLDTEDLPDMEIIYNSDVLSEFSYDFLSTHRSVKYDFVTAAVRDFAKGFGLYAGFNVDPETNKELPLDRYLLPYERLIHVPDMGSDVESRFVEVGRHMVDFTDLEYPYDLFAFTPENWERGSSLCNFKFYSESGFAKALQYGFYKNSVVRSINDDYGKAFFGTILGCLPELQCAGKNIKDSGIRYVARDKTDLWDIFESGDLKGAKPIENIHAYGGKGRLHQWLCNLFEEGYDACDPCGYALSFLKKDGGWYSLGCKSFSDKPDLERVIGDDVLKTLARDSEGNLRARMSIRELNCSMNTYLFSVKFRPQPIEMQVLSQSLSRVGNNVVTSLGIKNLEGCSDLIFQERIYDLSGKLLDARSFTSISTMATNRTYPNNSRVRISAYATNQEGETLSDVFEFENVLTNSSAVSMNRNGDSLSLVIEGDYASAAHYRVVKFDSNDNVPVIEGSSSISQDIDISSLGSGIYIVNVSDEFGEITSFKFQK